MPSKWNPDSGRTSGRSNPRRRSPQGNAWGQQRQQMGQQQAMQGALGNAQMQRPPAGPPMGMQSIQPPGGPVPPMGPPPMGGGMGMGDPMQRMAVQRAAGVFDKPQMAPPMPQFQRPDMSAAMAAANAQRDAFRQGGVGLPPQGIGPPPGGIPPMGAPRPMPPMGGGGFNPPAGKMMPNFGAALGAQRGAAGQMGSIQPPQMGGGGPVASPDMGMEQRRRAAGLAGGMRPGMM